MGCGNSTNTAVQPLTPEEGNGDEDETGSKLGGRGDSAVSKGTADSGVVMENRGIAALPGAVPRQLPPLTSETVRQGSLRGDGAAHNRQQSSQILEELLNEGIIPVGQSREKSSGAGEAYSIMLDDGEGVKRRPPARLESLKAKKAESLYSKEEIEEKIRLAEERRKSKEDELKTRLRSKSARVRGPAPTSSTEEDTDPSLTLVEPLQIPLSPDPTPATPLHSQLTGEAADGGERTREAGGDSRGFGEEMGGEDKREGRTEGGESGDNRGEGAEVGSEEGKEEEELTQVEEIKEGELLMGSEELESDSSFQHAEDKGEIF